MLEEITAAQARGFRDEGFMILESVAPEDGLEELRAECGRLITARDQETDRPLHLAEPLLHDGKTAS